MRVLGKKNRSIGMGTRGLAAGAVFAVLAGCTLAEPHVHRDGEFDRRTFTKSLATVPGEIQICYSAKGTTPAAVAALAGEECAKYNKSAQFIGNEVFNCPLSAPVAARYYCCPTPVNLKDRIRCSAAGGQAELLTADEISRMRKDQRATGRSLP